MNTMERSCPDVQTLAGWLEGSLPSRERSRLASHLSACDECRRTVAIASTVDAPPAAPVNELLLSKVVAASRRRRYVPLTAAAAAILAVAVGFTLIPKSRPSPAPVVAVETPRILDPVAVNPALEPVEPRPVVTAPPAPVTPPDVVKETPVAVKPVETPAAPIVEKPPVPAVRNTVVTPTPVVKEASAPVTPAVDPKSLAPVFVVDPTGDLWLRRDKAEAKAGSLEKMNYKDLFAARSSGAAFSLEARTSVMLEKGSEVAFSHLKTDDSYSLALQQGLVMLDTEGTTQKWQISFGNNRLSFSDFNGRLAVESRGDRMSALLLDGTAEIKIGAQAKKAQVGQEVVLSREGTVDEQKVETQKKLARLDELRPKVFTAFAATFDEKKDEFQPYPYAVVTGRLMQGPGGLYLQAEVLGTPKAGEKTVLNSEIHLDHPFGVVTGMVIRFRYRSSLPVFAVKIGKYSADFASRVKAGQWADGEISLRDFYFEGTPMLPTDPVENVRFTGSLDKKIGQLDIDGVQFLRRVR
jgi:hypothetical protein